MIVVDASAWVELLTNDGDLGEWVRAEVGRDARCVVASHTKIEVANSIRGKCLGGKISAQRGGNAIDVLRLIEMDVVPAEHVLGRIWELRSNVTAYDAAYIAIAEMHRCPLVTTDLKLVSAIGPECEFRHP